MSGCDAFRRLLDERLDGALAQDDASALEAHLAACADCRVVAAGLAAVREGLQSLPEHPLPPIAFEEVLDRTVRAGRRRPPARFAALWPAWAGAAAVVVLALLLARLPQGPSTLAQPSPAEVARARSEARLVLSLASDALHRAERAARDRVVTGEVAPALRRVPVRWVPTPQPRKS